MEFFTASHSKNACDGEGGTVKRLATRASLHGRADVFVVSPEALFKFSVENMEGLKAFYIDSKEIEACNKFLEEWYENAKTVPEIRENYYFRPLNGSTLLVKRVSSPKTSFKAVTGRENGESC
jgi:hypothetical protein